MQLLLTNKNNQTIDLLNNRKLFILYATEALHGVETDIKESESPYLDGSIVDNVKALPRGIELRFKITGDIKTSIDYFRSLIKSKQYVTLTEIEDGRELVIKGIATIPPYTRMAQACEIVLQVYCAQPYWEDLNYLSGSISTFINMLYFPKTGQYFTPYGRPFGVYDKSLENTFINDGDTSVGMLITINARGTIVNPKIACSSGTQNGWFMKLNMTLNDGDEIKINTVKQQKYITLNGFAIYNNIPILDCLEFQGDDWLQLETGKNKFNILADSGQNYLSFVIAYKGRYE